MATFHWLLLGTDLHIESPYLNWEYQRERYACVPVEFGNRFDLPIELLPNCWLTSQKVEQLFGRL